MENKQQQFAPNPFANPDGFIEYTKNVRSSISAQKEQDRTPQQPSQNETKETSNDNDVAQSQPIDIASSQSIGNAQKPIVSEDTSVIENGNIADALAEVRKHRLPNPFTDPEGFHAIAQRTHLLTNALSIMRENVQDIGIAEILAYLGAKTHKNDKNKWQFGAWNINTKGQLWFNFNEAKTSGGGPVSLAAHLLDTDEEHAIQWLADEFGGRPDLNDIKVDKSKVAATKKADFVVPESHPENLQDVKDYLHDKRKIPLPLIDRLVSEGKVYADGKKNCVFFAEGDPGMAEVRGTNSNFKGIATGGVRTVGFTVTPQKNAEGKIQTTGVAIVEAAIDAMSLHVLRPDLFVISAAGANFEFPEKVTTEAIKLGYKVYAAFDNDEAGNTAAAYLLEKFPGNVERLVPEGVKDWNEFLKAHPEKGYEYEQLCESAKKAVETRKAAHAKGRF